MLLLKQIVQFHYKYSMVASTCSTGETCAVDLERHVEHIGAEGVASGNSLIFK